MSLREQAAADLRTILEDTSGFGWPIKVTAPDHQSADLVGRSTDIHQAIDPETGILVSGRTASVALAIRSLTAAGLGIPTGKPKSNERPWVIEFADVLGASRKFKVSDARPDRAVGLVVCMLELWAE